MLELHKLIAVSSVHKTRRMGVTQERQLGRRGFREETE